MSTVISRPSGDQSIQWDASGTPHADQIDDPVEQPTVPSSDYIEANDGDENDVDDFHMDDVDIEGGNASEIKIWIYGKAVTGGNEDPSADILVEGSWQGYKVIDLTTSFGWHSQVWTGLNVDQANINALRVRLKAYSNFEKTDFNSIYCMYAKITYTVGGYAHDFIGVDSADIDEVIGVPNLNIDKIIGV